ncbi:MULTISPECIES: hypothetical protein [unclassified Imperialibacter]|uniref:hypothetical protein n=1 Tax=unclassified Imperialibacter TaxID=2629706 RepID=UPI001258CAAE|nr:MULTISPECIES: hypothetical protein [unclassified Imperialibacter]CAD5265490.1 hypothetical protein IMPERIA89_300116 [Imperialibacter sp. 89]CAD5270328.1 hypothetical protein IMPERIA75_360116 [Imperialibacter sp. 75]VVT09964.1 hypothetical protein IMPR6_180118 [Imperialibacter sp. EC-SDR9]
MMAINFEKYAVSGNEFIHMLAEKPGDRDEGHGGRIQWCAFRILRRSLGVKWKIWGVDF